MISKSWRERDWETMRRKLELLSVEDLKLIAVRTGVKFTGGIDSISDRPGASVKEQLILVLDESDPKELEQEYQRIIVSRGK
jgi:hypothetical protein